jgi:hypothetical protein
MTTTTTREIELAIIKRELAELDVQIKDFLGRRDRMPNLMLELKALKKRKAELLHGAA